MNILKGIPSELMEMITGKLLGDGNMIHDGKKATRLRFSHAAKDRGWCLHCYQALSKYMKLSPPTYRRCYDPRIIAGYTEIYYVQSFTWPVLEQIKKHWYPNGKKRVPYKYIKSFLTPLCLAWWYQDDGHLKKSKDGTVQKIILSTESFTFKEISFLKNQIYEKYTITFTIDKEKRLVLYDQPSILYFLSIVRPHLSSTMKRKDATFFIEDEQIPKKQRTTIYLPTSIKLQKPSEQIRHLMTALPGINEQLTDEISLQALLQNYLVTNKETQRLGYQIVLFKDQLIELTKMSKRTGLQKSECVELCYEYMKNGRLN